MTDTIAQPRVWLDTETTRLDYYKRPWEIALILRRPGQPDTEHQWFIHPADLDLDNADPESLKFGHFYERHPHGPALADGANPYDVPRHDGVHRILDVLPRVAALTADRAVVHGSNPSFDTDMLARSLGQLGIAPTWHYHPEDVPGVARGWLLGRGLPAPRKSDAISRACGIDPDRYDRHTALGDCRWLRDLSDLIEPRCRPTLEEALDALLDQPIGIRFWVCPVAGHSSRNDETGRPVVTVEWRGDIAYCTADNCGRNSQQTTTEEKP